MVKKIKKIIPKEAVLKYHKWLALFAATIYGNPSKNATVIGVTGTDGKTSSTIIISQLLDALGHKTAYMTTAEFKIADKKWINKTKQTMQGRLKLQKFIKEAVEQGCSHIVIETSSQGIEQSRHIGIQYDVAVFTNLSPDHIEAHGSFENYRKEKEKLFEIVSAATYKPKIEKKMVINADDKAAHYFKAYNHSRSSTYSIHADADYRAENIHVVDEKTEFTLVYKEEKIHIKTELFGEFNVYNLLDAIAATHGLGEDLHKCAKAAGLIKPIPGRLEKIDEGQDFFVFVDYAHAENALENVLKTAKEITDGNIISVLGSCGGGRDIEKRPRLGAIAAKYAQTVIVTNEDPYDEDPMAIIAAVAEGAEKSGKIKKENLYQIEDRKEAIKKAVSAANTGDIVIITGKGSEQSMVVKNEKKIPWDDRDVARNALKELSRRGSMKQ